MDGGHPDYDEQLQFNNNDNTNQNQIQNHPDYDDDDDDNVDDSNGGNGLRHSINDTSRDSSAGKLFVGGIAWETSEESFGNYFSNYGELTDTEIMMDKITGRPRGFGFVTFANAADADKVLEQDHVIDGRPVEVKRTVPREDIQQGGNRGVSRTKKIFVGGIPLTLTEDEMREYFSNYGDIIEHQIMLDHVTGRSRGFGFVTFDSEEAVDKIFADGQLHELGGKQVEIKRAEPKRGGGDFSYDNRSRRGGGGGGYKSYGGGFGRGSAGYGGGYGGKTDRGSYDEYGGGYAGYDSYGGGGYGGGSAGFYPGYGGYGYGYGYGGPMYGGAGYAGAGYGGGYGASAGYGGGRGYGSGSGGGGYGGKEFSRGGGGSASGGGYGYGYGYDSSKGYDNGSSGGGGSSFGTGGGRFHPYRK